MKKLSYLVIIYLLYAGLSAAPPEVSQVFVDQDSITFQIEVIGQDTLRIWHGNVVFTLFDPDSDWCRITLEVNKPNAQIESYFGDTLITNGQNKKVYFTISAYEELGYDVKLKVIADDSLPYLGTVAGTTIMYDGFPAQHTRVMLIPGDYNPVEDGSVPDSCIDTTDEDGYYTIGKVPSGQYSIYGLGFINFSRLLHSGVSVIGPETIQLIDTLYIPGKVKLSTTVLPAYTQDSYLYIPGTIKYEMIDSLEYINDQIMIDSIPPGIISGIDFSILGIDTVIHVVDTFSVFTGETTVIQGY